VQGVYSQNPQEQYEATQWFRKLLSIGEHLLFMYGTLQDPVWLAAGCISSRQVVQQFAAVVVFTYAGDQRCMHAVDYLCSSSNWQGVCQQ
jgi:hypothetical protein